jgi:hypothetical protein
MGILVAIKREERKLEKQLSKLQRQLNGVRAAAKALDRSANREIWREEARVVRRSESKDCEGGQETMGEVQGPERQGMKPE